MASLMRPRTESIRRLRIEESTAVRWLSIEGGGGRDRDDDGDGGCVVERLGEGIVGGA